MSVARFVADQRTLYRVPVAFTCALLGVSVSWFYKWRDRAPTKTEKRRARLDAAVARAFTAARGLHGSPRLLNDLREKGWKVSEKTIADSMRRQGLVARKVKRRNGLTKQDRSAPKFPDLVRRDFTAAAVNIKWVGDITEIPTAAGKLYLATVIDLYSRRLLAAATSLHPDASLAADAIRMAVAVRGGRQAIEGVILHTDRGSTGGFNWSSQHLEREELLWLRGSVVDLRTRVVRRCAPQGVRRWRGGSIGSCSGPRSLGAARARTPAWTRGARQVPRDWVWIEAIVAVNSWSATARTLGARSAAS